MIGHLLNRTLDVHRASRTRDAVGGSSVTTFNPVGSVRVTVMQPTVEERQIGSQFGGNLSHIVYTSTYNDVRRGDHLAGDLPSDIPPGSRLRVVAVISNSRQTYRRLGCEVTQSEDA